MQGRAPPLVSGVDGGATSHQSLQTLIVTAGRRIVEGSPGEQQREGERKKESQANR